MLVKFSSETIILNANSLKAKKLNKTLESKITHHLLALNYLQGLLKEN